MKTTLTGTAERRPGRIRGRVEIDIQRCKGCELCTAACKEQVLQLSGTVNSKGYRYIVADNSRCTGCVNCALVCPDAVITVYRTRPSGKRTEVTDTDVRSLLPTIISPE